MSRGRRTCHAICLALKKCILWKKGLMLQILFQQKLTDKTTNMTEISHPAVFPNHPTKNSVVIAKIYCKNWTHYIS